MPECLDHEYDSHVSCERRYSRKRVCLCIGGKNGSPIRFLYSYIFFFSSWLFLFSSWLPVVQRKVLWKDKYPLHAACANGDLDALHTYVPQEVSASAAVVSIISIDSRLTLYSTRLYTVLSNHK